MATSMPTHKDAVNGSQLFATSKRRQQRRLISPKASASAVPPAANIYALGDTINVKGDGNIISETVAGWRTG